MGGGARGAAPPPAGSWQLPAICYKLGLVFGASQIMYAGVGEERGYPVRYGGEWARRAG